MHLTYYDVFCIILVAMFCFICDVFLIVYFLFVVQLCRFTDLRSAVVLGGDRLEDQFASMHGNPDM